MCYPGVCQRADVSSSAVEGKYLGKYWSPLQLVKSINKSIISNGLDISRKIVRVTGKAHRKVVTVKRWVVDLNFSQIIIPLSLLAFITLLHPHTEIQVGAVTIFSVLFLTFLLLSRSSSSSDAPAPVSTPVSVIPVSTSLALYIYSHLPLASLSRGWGWLTSSHFPQPLQHLIIWVYASKTGCLVEEAERPLSSYSSLSEFFTRRLKPGLRPVDDEFDLVSPADGTITHSSPLETPYTHTVKGLSYSLDTFLGETENICDTVLQDDDNPKLHYQQQLSQYIHSHLLLNAQQNTQLYETTIYLSPGDYHRFHSPTDWVVTMRRHFPGTMYSVSPSLVKLMPSCIMTNERVAWFGRWKWGTFILVAVAATNVGDIQTEFDTDLATNTNNREATEKIYKKPLEFRKGDDFGHFNFGSTLVLLYEAPRVFHLAEGPVRRIKMGQRLWI